MGKKPKKASVNLRVRRLIMKYLTKNRKPFSYDGIIQELIENDIILDIEKEDAINVIEDLYGTRAQVRNPILKGWYPNSGSKGTGVPSSKPPTYPVRAAPDPSAKLE